MWRAIERASEAGPIMKSKIARLAAHNVSALWASGEMRNSGNKMRGIENLAGSVRLRQVHLDEYLRVSRSTDRRHLFISGTRNRARPGAIENELN